MNLASVRIVRVCARFPLALALVLLSMGIIPARAADPIKIGFSAQLTGALASSGKANLLAQQIWMEEINAKGGLLGRPVQLVYYDDQTNPSTVPGIYTKLLDIDKVDLLMGAASNIVVAAMPIVIQRNKLVMALVALGVNDNFRYSRYFQTAPWGADARSAMSRGFFEVARLMTPQPKSVALVGLDAEAAANVLEGARARAKDEGLRIVYDRSYPPNTTDFGPTVRAIAAANPDLVFIASYPIDSVGMVRAAHELNLKTMMFGGAMVGLQYASIRVQLGEYLNRVVNYELWTPGAKMKFPGIEEFLKKYQERAQAEGADPLGYYQPPFAYAAMQVLEQAIKATASLDDAKLADCIHSNTFRTIVGDIAFDARGEWTKSRVLTVQFQNIKGSRLEQYMKEGAQVILYPPEYRDGEPQPFTK
jgi:branched-chain amino acid transport system substrate-binding protein